MAQMDTDEGWLNEVSGRVIGCAYTVLNKLGPGFLEKVYENALAHELRKSGLSVTQQRGLTVLYDGIVAGEYVVDLLVEDVLLVELKAVKTLDETHRAQCLNYLRASCTRLCLLLNFGTARLEVKRLINDF